MLFHLAAGCDRWYLIVILESVGEGLTMRNKEKGNLKHNVTGSNFEIQPTPFSSRTVGKLQRYQITSKSTSKVAIRSCVLSQVCIFNIITGFSNIEESSLIDQMKSIKYAHITQVRVLIFLFWFRRYPTESAGTWGQICLLAQRVVRHVGTTRRSSCVACLFFGFLDSWLALFLLPSALFIFPLIRVSFSKVYATVVSQVALNKRID